VGLTALAQEPSAKSSRAAAPSTDATASKPADRPAGETTAKSSIRVAEIPPFVKKAVDWLIAAQTKNGGWGSGSLPEFEKTLEMQKRPEAAQGIKAGATVDPSAPSAKVDPQNVPADPGTTAFVLLALLRAGHTPIDGQYKDQVRRGLKYLLLVVKDAPLKGPLIPNTRTVSMRITGGTNRNTLANINDQLGGTYSQPQLKLGSYVDTPLTAQYLGRAVGLLTKDDPLYRRTSAALDKCLINLQASQQVDGSWGMSDGWAPVLQSSLGCSALEIALANGKKIDQKRLERARSFQKRRVDALASRRTQSSGSASDGSGGVELYAFNAAFRGNASEARQAEATLNQAKYSGKLPQDAEPTQTTFKQLGFADDKARLLEKAIAQNYAQTNRLNDETLLAGFGSNGGEEFLSYLLTSESLVIAGGDKFNAWNDKMHDRLEKLQDSDGSWSGMHCITSPVFCTAAVVQCLTTDRDADFLISMAEKAYGSDDKKTEAAKK
jgi:hypothetical protein